MKANKRKNISTAIAFGLAIVILLTGTFAWQSISQTAKNEVMEPINIGGRLHDDFNGQNKDVYVENFTEANNGGQPIFVRVRLDEYMEVGKDAGINRKDESGNPKTDRKVNVITGGSIHNVDTWSIHKPTDDVTTCAANSHKNWTWTMGGKTVFMPTFNKNKDSLKSDINGTIEGKDGDGLTNPEKQYSDYKTYAVGEKLKGAEIYDADDNSIDEASPVEDTNIHTVADQEHTAKDTKDATVLTMAQWKASGSPVGAYWVYDVDGWAYWAQAIEPGEATGLLLDEINMTKPTDENCYYAINVVAQFATANDWGSETDPTGFYDTAHHATPPTEDALNLLYQAAGIKPIVKVSTAGNVNIVKAGKTLQCSAVVSLAGKNIANQDVTWDVSGNVSENTTIDTSGILTVGSDETATSLVVKATSDENGAIGEKKLQVKPLEIADITDITPGSTQCITVDDMQWYVLAKEGNKALIWSKGFALGFGEGALGSFGENNIWRDSAVRKWLNNSFLDSIPTLATKIAETEITTRSGGSAADWITTTDKVFLLSEADLSGTFDASETTEAKDYTYQGRRLLDESNPAFEELNKSSGEGSLSTTNQWLRSPRTVSGVTDTHVATNSNDGTGVGSEQVTTSTLGVRPAMWIIFN